MSAQGGSFEEESAVQSGRSPISLMLQIAVFSPSRAMQSQTEFSTCTARRNFDMGAGHSPQAIARCVCAPGTTTHLLLRLMSPTSRRSRTATQSGIRYTRSGSLPPVTTRSNADLVLISDTTRTGFILSSGAPFIPRTFSGIIRYAGDMVFGDGFENQTDAGASTALLRGAQATESPRNRVRCAHARLQTWGLIST